MDKEKSKSWGIHSPEDSCGGFYVVELKIDTKKRRKGERLNVLGFMNSKALSTEVQVAKLRKEGGEVKDGGVERRGILLSGIDVEDGERRLKGVRVGESGLVKEGVWGRSRRLR